MTLAAALAAIHAEAFDTPWPVSAFASLLGQTGVILEAEDEGFILIRVAADEAEILTLAVRLDERRKGVGRRLIAHGARRAAALGAHRLLLEVAEDNAPARALYAASGFSDCGRRPRYYARVASPSVDALLLVLNLTGPLPTG